jgi:CRP/FNR family transcriptional regulator, cyclic AMP receptor protein
MSSVSDWTIWHAVPLDLRSKLAMAVQIRRFAHGHTVFRQGDMPTAVYGLVSGAIRHEMHIGDRKPALLSVLPRHHWFGETAASTGSAHGFTAVCSGSVTVVELPLTQFNQLVDSTPAMGRLVMSWVSAKERLLRTYLAEANALSLEVRLARTLLAIERVFSEPYASGGRMLTVDLSQEDYGDLLGATRQRINQIIQQWVRAGHLQVRYKHLIIQDSAALTVIAEGLEPAVEQFIQASVGAGSTT